MAFYMDFSNLGYMVDLERLKLHYICFKIDGVGNVNVRKMSA